MERVALPQWEAQKASLPCWWQEQELRGRLPLPESVTRMAAGPLRLDWLSRQSLEQMLQLWLAPVPGFR
jgi:hypothetical protein